MEKLEVHWYYFQRREIFANSYKISQDVLVTLEGELRDESKDGVEAELALKIIV